MLMTQLLQYPQYITKLDLNRSTAMKEPIRTCTRELKITLEGKLYERKHTNRELDQHVQLIQSQIKQT